jgi:methionyl-tRNA formyltransferase
MGTGGFVVPSFQSLCASTHDIVAVITRPDKSGVGKKMPPPAPMRIAAQQTDIPIHDPASINASEAHELLKSLCADLFVVCDYGQILSAETLSLARLGGINLHGSLLPAYRGAAPVQWAVYDGCSETGVTTIHMTPRLDAGPILTTRTTPILSTDTADLLEVRLAQLGVDAVHEAIDMLERWDGHSPIGQLQDPSHATKAPRIQKADGQIDWHRSARQIDCQVRAFQPWPMCYTWCQPLDKAPIRLVIHQVTVLEQLINTTNTTPPGTVLQSSPEWIIATGQGTLKINIVQPAGKKPMPAADFLRGHNVPVGQRLEARGERRETSGSEFDHLKPKA